MVATAVAASTSAHHLGYIPTHPHRPAMALDTIAMELLFLVTDHLEIESFASLLFANRSFHHCLTEKFHRRAIADDGGVSALRHAAATGNLMLSTTLLARGATPNPADPAGDASATAATARRQISPLHIAALAGDLPLCRLLVQCGAKPFEPIDATPSLLARWRGVFSPSRRPYLPRLTPLGCAVCHEHAGVARFLLDTMDAQATSDWFSSVSELFEFALEQRYLSVIAVFLARDDGDVDPVALNWFLRPATAAGSAEVVRMLLDAGADVEGCPSNWRPLHVAAYRGRIDVVRVLLSRGAEVDSLSHATRDQPKTALVVAARTAVNGLPAASLIKTPPEDRAAEAKRIVRGAREAAMLLVEHGADVDFAIHLVDGLIAAASEKRDIVGFLEGIRSEGTT